MVGRRLNKPLAKCRQYVVFWMQQVLASRWFCRQCSKMQEKGSLAFEVTVRFARSGAKGEKNDSPVKLYYCLDCAEVLLAETLEKVKTAKKHGADGYRLLDEIR